MTAPLNQILHRDVPTTPHQLLFTNISDQENSCFSRIWVHSNSLGLCRVLHVWIGESLSREELKFHEEICWLCYFMRGADPQEGTVVRLVKECEITPCKEWTGPCWPVKEKCRGDQGHLMCSRKQARCVRPNGMKLWCLNEATRKQISVWYIQRTCLRLFALTLEWVPPWQGCWSEKMSDLPSLGLILNLISDKPVKSSGNFFVFGANRSVYSKQGQLY